jgi:hypothetical protein
VRRPSPDKPVAGAVAVAEPEEAEPEEAEEGAAAFAGAAPLADAVAGPDGTSAACSGPAG